MLACGPISDWGQGLTDSWDQLVFGVCIKDLLLTESGVTGCEPRVSC